MFCDRNLLDKCLLFPKFYNITIPLSIICCSKCKPSENVCTSVTIKYRLHASRLLITTISRCITFFWPLLLLLSFLLLLFLQMLQRNINNQTGVMNKLNNEVERILRESGQTSAPVKKKLDEMNKTFTAVQRVASDKKNQLSDQLSEVTKHG